MLFEILTETGIDPTITDILKSAYQKELSALILNNKRKIPCQVHKGVRQGACSSPQLFNLVPDKLARALQNSTAGIRIDDGQPINCLLYADDIALVAKNHRDAQILADQVQT